jgi:hypothetical protein
MKRSLLASLFCLTALLLVSFANKKPEITKIGDNLYKVNGLDQMSEADQRTMRAMMAKYYGIEDFTTKHDVQRLVTPGRGGAIIERTVLKDFFEKNAVVWEARTTPNADEETLLKMMAKYAG